MNYAVAKNWGLFAMYGQRTLITAMAVSGGIMMVSSVYRLYNGLVLGRVKKEKQTNKNGNNPE